MPKRSSRSGMLQVGLCSFALPFSGSRSMPAHVRAACFRPSGMPSPPCPAQLNLAIDLSRVARLFFSGKPVALSVRVERKNRLISIFSKARFLSEGFKASGFPFASRALATGFPHFLRAAMPGAPCSAPLRQNRWRAHGHAPASCRVRMSAGHPPLHKISYIRKNIKQATEFPCLLPPFMVFLLHKSS